MRYFNSSILFLMLFMLICSMMMCLSFCWMWLRVSVRYLVGDVVWCFYFAWKCVPLSSRIIVNGIRV